MGSSGTKWNRSLQPLQLLLAIERKFLGIYNLYCLIVYIPKGDQFEVHQMEG